MGAIPSREYSESPRSFRMVHSDGYDIGLLPVIEHFFPSPESLAFTQLYECRDKQSVKYTFTPVYKLSRDAIAFQRRASSAIINNPLPILLPDSNADGSAAVTRIPEYGPNGEPLVGVKTITRENYEEFFPRHGVYELCPEDKEQDMWSPLRDSELCMLEEHRRCNATNSGARATNSASNGTAERVNKASKDLPSPLDEDEIEWLMDFYQREPSHLYSTLITSQRERLANTNSELRERHRKEQVWEQARAVVRAFRKQQRLSCSSNPNADLTTQEKQTNGEDNAAQRPPSQSLSSTTTQPEWISAEAAAQAAEVAPPESFLLCTPQVFLVRMSEEQEHAAREKFYATQRENKRSSGSTSNGGDTALETGGAAGEVEGSEQNRDQHPPQDRHRFLSKEEYKDGRMHLVEEDGVLYLFAYNTAFIKNTQAGNDQPVTTTADETGDGEYENHNASDGGRYYPGPFTLVNHFGRPPGSTLRGAIPSTAASTTSGAGGCGASETDGNGEDPEATPDDGAPRESDMEVCRLRLDSTAEFTLPVCAVRVAGMTSYLPSTHRGTPWLRGVEDDPEEEYYIEKVLPSGSRPPVVTGYSMIDATIGERILSRAYLLSISSNSSACKEVGLSGYILRPLWGTELLMHLPAISFSREIRARCLAMDRHYETRVREAQAAVSRGEATSVEPIEGVQLSTIVLNFMSQCVRGTRLIRRLRPDIQRIFMDSFSTKVTPISSDLYSTPITRMDYDYGGTVHLNSVFAPPAATASEETKEMSEAIRRYRLFEEAGQVLSPPLNINELIQLYRHNSQAVANDEEPCLMVYVIVNPSERAKGASVQHNETLKKYPVKGELYPPSDTPLDEPHKHQYMYPANTFVDGDLVVYNVVHGMWEPLAPYHLRIHAERSKDSVNNDDYYDSTKDPSLSDILLCWVKRKLQNAALNNRNDPGWLRDSNGNIVQEGRYCIWSFQHDGQRFFYGLIPRFAKDKRKPAKALAVNAASSNQSDGTQGSVTTPQTTVPHALSDSNMCPSSDTRVAESGRGPISSPTPEVTLPRACTTSSAAKQQCGHANLSSPNTTTPPASKKTPEPAIRGKAAGSKSGAETGAAHPSSTTSTVSAKAKVATTASRNTLTAAASTTSQRVATPPQVFPKSRGYGLDSQPRTSEGATVSVGNEAVGSLQAKSGSNPAPHAHMHTTPISTLQQPHIQHHHYVDNAPIKQHPLHVQPQSQPPPPQQQQQQQPQRQLPLTIPQPRFRTGTAPTAMSPPSYPSAPWHHQQQPHSPLPVDTQPPTPPQQRGPQGGPMYNAPGAANMHSPQYYSHHHQQHQGSYHTPHSHRDGAALYDQQRGGGGSPSPPYGAESGEQYNNFPQHQQQQQQYYERENRGGMNSLAPHVQAVDSASYTPAGQQRQRVPSQPQSSPPPPQQQQHPQQHPGNPYSMGYDDYSGNTNYTDYSSANMSHHQHPQQYHQQHMAQPQSIGYSYQHQQYQAPQYPPQQQSQQYSSSTHRSGADRYGQPAKSPVQSNTQYYQSDPTPLAQQQQQQQQQPTKGQHRNPHYQQQPPQSQYQSTPTFQQQQQQGSPRPHQQSQPQQYHGHQHPPPPSPPPPPPQHQQQQSSSRDYYRKTQEAGTGYGDSPQYHPQQQQRGQFSQIQRTPQQSPYPQQQQQQQQQPPQQQYYQQPQGSPYEMTSKGEAPLPGPAQGMQAQRAEPHTHRIVLPDVTRPQSLTATGAGAGVAVQRQTPDLATSTAARARGVRTLAGRPTFSHDPYNM